MRKALTHAGRLVLWMFPLLTGLTLLPGAWHSKDLHDALLQIAELHRQGKDEESIPLAANLVSEDPGNSVIREVYVLVLAKQQDRKWLFELINDGSDAESNSSVAELESQYKEALLIDSTNDACWHNLSWVEWIRGEHGNALSSIRQAIELQPTDPTYRVTGGLFLELSRDLGKASIEYGRAFEISPRIVESDFYSDLTKRNPRLAQDSVQIAEISLRKNVADPVAAAKLGRLELDLGRAAEAEVLLGESLQQLPNLGGAWLSLAFVKARTGQNGQVEDDLHKALYLLYDYSSKVGSISSTKNTVFDPANLRKQKVFSLHARRAHTQYWTENPLSNDILPENLMEYLAPND